MFRNWLKILPFFVVEWLAKRKCEVFQDEHSYYVSPWRGVRFTKTFKGQI